MLLALSILALLAGPVAYTLGRRNPVARQILDGFIFITIAGIVTVNIIPEALGGGGQFAILFLVLGIVFPVLLERGLHHRFHAAHAIVLALAALGLVIHSTLDGIALLIAPMSEDGQRLAWAVVLHRLPVGMAIWWSLRPNLGLTAAVAAFVLIIVSTTAPVLLGTPLVEITEARSVAWLQAFISGSLIHIVAFGVSHDHDKHVEPVAQFQDWGYRLGILIGLFLVFTAPELHH
ncbi:MAG: hypothetical protein KJP08_04980 [Gammaproteobacteria bacterium]|nr:hypothetical protein [Gammaproteobacteria bacterium]NNF49740.1 hypothetical protein [Woeseiaceae bacterium]MBT8094144.1 hypothetical protein [Gammaproteobacteria bacterium]MBT8106541.1 hypothetical protein [Gammaproteobacteria bacterium]NNK26556.1 hypothetical protein [Woeseiaceae bacterium]